MVYQTQCKLGFRSHGYALYLKRNGGPQLILRMRAYNPVSNDGQARIVTAWF